MKKKCREKVPFVEGEYYPKYKVAMYCIERNEDLRLQPLTRRLLSH
jgi:hypothetical protein